MMIVVLDGGTLNPGDLSWEGLEQLGQCAIYERTSPSDVVSRAAEAEAVLTNKTPLSAATLARLPRLRYVGILATGHNIVEVEAARSRGITVTNVPDYSTMSVAQLAFAHILHLTHHVAEHAASVRQGDWTASPDFSYAISPLIELSGLTLGVVGFGRIGRRTAAIGLAFGMRVLAHSITPVDTPGVEPCTLDILLRLSDVVSLHCPLTVTTRHMIDRERLALMKPTAFLINTSRGPLVDEGALADALNAGRIAGAGLDVLSTEPPAPGNPLLAAAHCFLTPHIAWATRAARQRLMHEVTKNLQAFIDGQGRNVVV